MQELILFKLSSLKKPIKTKQLAGRLGIDSNELTKYLNEAENENKVRYVYASTRQQDRFHGWVIAPKLDLHVRKYKEYLKSLNNDSHVRKYKEYSSVF